MSAQPKLSLRRVPSDDVIKADALSEAQRVWDLTLTLRAENPRRCAWVGLDEIIGLPGLPATVAELRKWLLVNDKKLEDWPCGNYSETPLVCLPSATLTALLIKRRREKEARRAVEDEARSRPAMCGWVKTAKLIGLPGLPVTLPEIEAWVRQKGFILGSSIDAAFLPIETRRALADRREREASAPVAQPCVATPDHWAVMAVLSKVALAQLAGKGVRLDAEQVAILAAHLELSGAQA